jgi:hypothetical protein
MAFNSFFLFGITIAFISQIASTKAEQCSATAYYHKKTEYDSGIYFHHGKKYHQGIYGSFWNEVNETMTKNVGLKRNTFGYDKEMYGYIWANSTEYGFVGGGKGYILGLQSAMGQIAGLLTPETENAFQNSYDGKTKGVWNSSSGLPDLSKPDGRSAVTAIDTVMNYTNTIKAIQNVTESNDDDNNLTPKQRRSLAHLEVIEVIEMEKRENEDDADCDDEDDDEDDKGIQWKHTPQQSAVYRPPWLSAKPVYFFGQCDTCDKHTGFNGKGHGSFQSCSLIYRGREYFGKPDETEHLRTCKVEFDC